MTDIKDFLRDVLGDDADLTEILMDTEADEAGGDPPPAPEPEGTTAQEDDTPEAAAEPDEPEPEPEPEVALSSVETAAPVTQVCNTPTFTNDEMLEAMDLRQLATLVTLHTRRWHAKAKDRKAARDMARSVGADDAAYDAYKKLLVGQDETLERVRKAIDAARTKHYEMTLPWSTEGPSGAGKRTGGRLLPNTRFMEYTMKMGAHKQEMEDALRDFVAAYPQLVQAAQQKLGQAYVPSDYPHPDTIRQFFMLSFEFLPIPQGGDFSGIVAAQAEKLSETLDRRNRTMLENAMQEAWSRMRELVERAADRYGAPDRQFHYTLPERLKQAATDFKHFNMVSDTTMEEIRHRIEKELAVYDAEAIRNDDGLRARLGTVAQELLDKMNNYGGTTNE